MISRTPTLPLLALLVLTPAFGGDPADIPGNVVWLDGSDPDGDGVPGGGFVNGNRWIDKSAAGGANAIQTTGMRRPQVVAGAWNGLSAVRFDGNDYMEVHSSTFGMLNGVDGATLFAVASTLKTGGQRVFMISTGGSSSQTRAGVNLFDSFGTSIGGSGDYGAAGRRLDSDSFQRIEGGSITMGQLEQYAALFDYDQGHLSLYVDGLLETYATNFQSPGSTSPTNSVNIRVGADADLNQLKGTFRGDLAEVLVYDRLLSAAERETVEAYLHAKWFSPAIGTSYCDPAVPNSSGAPGAMSGAGSELAANNDVTLIASDLPPSQFGYFITSQTSGFVAGPGGSQGNLCLGGTVGRYISDVASSGLAGTLLLRIDLNDMPSPVQTVVLPGETWHFQAWHRDQNPTSTSNFTNGLAVSFL